MTQLPTMRQIRFLLLLVPLLLGAACDPQGPGAMGQIVVPPEANLVAGLTLEIRMVQDDGEAFNPTIADLSVEYPIRQASWDLADIEFPFDYIVGGGLGSTEHEQWRAVAWIAESEDVDRPKPGESFGTRVFSLEDCGVIFAKYCGVMRDIDLKIESSQPEAMLANYIEKSYGDYTLRCKTGDDPADSLGSYVITISTSDRAISEVVGDRDGEIQDCWMADIDADDDAEVLLFTRLAGSGGYAELYVYQFSDDELRPIELSDPDVGLLSGYQGRDTYKVTDGELSRNFPVYLADDPNCCPGGGEKTIVYDRSRNSWQLAADRVRD